MGFPETHETNDDRLPENLLPGYKFYSKARVGGQGGGVGVAVHSCLSQQVKPFVFRQQQYAEAFWLVMQRQGPARKLYIGAAYMPDISKPQAVRETAYEQLQQDLQWLASRGAVVVVGDFNARVGRASSPTQHIGMHGEPHQNANGRLLVSMLAAVDMYALNARTPAPAGRPDAHLTYVKHSSTGQVLGSSLIDYIIATPDIAMPVLSSATPSACVADAVVSGTDHLPVVATIHRPALQRSARVIRLKLNARPGAFKSTGEPSPELAAYHNALSRLGPAYNDLIAALGPSQAATADAVQQAHEQLVSIIKEAVMASFGYKRVVAGKSLPWWNQDLTAAINARVTTYNRYRESGSQEDWAAYQQQRRSAHQLVEAAKQKFKEDKAKAITAAYYQQGGSAVLCARDMWRLVDTLCPKQGGAAYHALRHPAGFTATSAAEKADAFKCHYQRVGSHSEFSAANPQFDQSFMLHVQGEVQLHLLESHSVPAVPLLDSAISLPEISACLQSLANNKSGNPAEEGIVNELLKHGGSTMAGMLLQYCNLMWQLEQVHHVPGTIISMPKKGDLSDPSNYRGITLLSTLYKVYTSVLNARLIKFAEGAAQQRQQQPATTEQRSEPQAATQQQQQQQPSPVAEEQRQQQQQQQRQRQQLARGSLAVLLVLVLLWCLPTVLLVPSAAVGAAAAWTWRAGGRTGLDLETWRGVWTWRAAGSQAASAAITTTTAAAAGMQQQERQPEQQLGQLLYQQLPPQRAQQQQQHHDSDTQSDQLQQQQQQQQQQQSSRAARCARRQHLPLPQSQQQQRRERTTQQQQRQQELKALVSSFSSQPQQQQSAQARLHEGQNGFRPTRSCADHQFLLHQIMCGRKAEQKDTFLLFVDTYKAFPTVWLDGLFAKLWEAGVCGKMFRVLYNLYQGAHRVVNYEGCTTDAFSCDLGLHEGDVISPTLYLFFIDGLLREVENKHPGVTLVGPSRSVVVAMQADDLVCVCASAAEMQAVAQTVYAYSCKWRFRLNSSKSAVMHVAATGSQQLTDSGIVWNNESVPVIDKYCYLGLWFQNDCGWRYHIQQTLERAEKVKNRLMPVWKNRHVSVDVKRVLLLSLIRPIFEHGSEVWWPSTCRQVELLNKVQTDVIKCAMRCENENPSSMCVLAEWGLQPLNMWLEARAIEYFFRVLRMPDNRLPKQVLHAVWRDVAGNECLLAWQSRVLDLLSTYSIDCGTCANGKEECKKHVKKMMAARFGEVVVTKAACSSTLSRYVAHVSGHSFVEGIRCFAGPRPFLSGARHPGYGIELLMRVRMQCLAVHARTSKYTRGDNTSRVCCPSCGDVADGGETLHHLMFSCPAYSAARSSMFEAVSSVPGCVVRLRRVLTGPHCLEKVLDFVSDCWGSAEVASAVSLHIAHYLEQAWSLRNKCKHSQLLYTAFSHSAERRGADGVLAMA